MRQRKKVNSRLWLMLFMVVGYLCHITQKNNYLICYALLVKDIYKFTTTHQLFAVVYLFHTKSIVYECWFVVTRQILGMILSFYLCHLFVCVYVCVCVCVCVCVFDYYIETLDPMTAALGKIKSGVGLRKTAPVPVNNSH